jgi:hypothetical protein
MFTRPAYNAFMRGAAACVLLVAAGIWAQPPPAFVPVGVVVGAATGPPTSADREELMAFARLRFNVVARRIPAGEIRLESLARALGQRSADAGLSAAGVERVAVGPRMSGAEIRSLAWQAIARGARGVVFDGAAELADNPDALQAASAFADNVTRNAALFAPLKPRTTAGGVRVDGGTPEIEAQFLESPDALVLVVVNRAASVRQVTLAFAADIPEAIWQNMENGAAVNFVAGPVGPIYTRSFAPHDVLVLMIRKQYK